jgi:chemotaxis protein MotA
MDIATLIGFLVGLACVIVGVVADGGNFALFFNIPAVTIVVGGTIASTCIHFSAKQVLGVAAVMKKTMFCKLPAESDLIQKMVNYAAINRRDGALALERQVATAGDPFLVKAIRMVIDGQKEEAIEEQLALEIQYLQERHADGKKMLEFMGAGCPAMGMVGTLVGLVQMFSNMESPEKIGAGMAAALVCTFYGAFLANLYFLPMAGKLGIRTKKERILREMVLEGVIGLVRGESPTNVRERMQAFVSAMHREELKPKV